MSTHLVIPPQPGKISRQKRESANGHKAFVLWITGLSGAGKSTLACALEEELFNRGCKTLLLDGDNLRRGLCQDLGFTREDRQENLRRAAETSRLMVDAGLIVIAAFITPLEEDRQLIRNIIGEEDYIQIYCQCSLATCEARDVKGLYKRARNGEIPGFTGIDSPYEIPANSQLVLDTENHSIDNCKHQVLDYLIKHELIN